VILAGQDKRLGPKWPKLLSAHRFFWPAHFGAGPSIRRDCPCRLGKVLGQSIQRKAWPHIFAKWDWPFCQFCGPRQAGRAKQLTVFGRQYQEIKRNRVAVFLTPRHR